MPGAWSRQGTGPYHRELRQLLHLWSNWRTLLALRSRLWGTPVNMPASHLIQGPCRCLPAKQEHSTFRSDPFWSLAFPVLRHPATAMATGAAAALAGAAVALAGAAVALISVEIGGEQPPLPAAGSRPEGWLHTIEACVCPSPPHLSMAKAIQRLPGEAYLGVSANAPMVLQPCRGRTHARCAAALPPSPGAPGPRQAREARITRVSKRVGTLFQPASSRTVLWLAARRLSVAGASWRRC